ncbi:serine dehydratase-like isoform X2 [Meles meles]|nr:serine dehydratase-like isoform X2 [Meles meles]XP_045881035.1 serine dehydratase-like isoform X2 [Meles meles]XP_045881036.1 serine dehydratase-like isoform X2 [Meles meles]XP_045881037.1 serine dehydratase-like isoform X2 [Meles meles]XP_045881038.1 serine dehydratase-like isoform X2 [Meles meles]XP_045881039.1 serine dehydratase-like isoform X2 [Meles meles]XP_045881040.1 serine dehydratase-like isoform X2 [Meles meles]XP_045881041.1 serine dehydratase-like isoform X2 [Meles meles]
MESSLTGCTKPEHFHTVTPLLESWALSQVAGTTVFLKCENVQPAGSFKIRGIGHFCQEVAKKGCRHLVCSSGGNAGIAAAYAARKLGIPATIVLPEGTSLQVVRRLQGEGAEVQLTGKVWDEASLKAQELAKRDGWVNVPPFDHPLIWEGHASLVRELKTALGTPPGALVLAVGGGGLLAGVSAGLIEVGWQDVPIIAVETQGAHCFNAAIKAGRLVTLPEITSVARSLGAKTVAARALACTQELDIISEVVEDGQAVSAVQQFLDDERMLVEPACGAPLAVIYSGLLGRLQAKGRLHPSLASVVVIVCGGNNIDSGALQALKAQLGQS